MARGEMIAELASIIKDFRKDELDFNLDEAHITRWINQFPNDVKDIILSETVFVFSSWYYNHAKIEDFFNSVVDCLCKKYGFETAYNLCKHTSFVNVQKTGQSQKRLHHMLRSQLYEQYQITLRSDVSNEISHYVYIDDGLYTGSRARKDLKELIPKLPPKSNLYVFYIFAGTSGLNYTERELASLAKECSITIAYHSKCRLENNKTIITRYEDDTQIDEYVCSQRCLWPDIELRNNDAVKAYEGFLLTLGDKHKKKLYRATPWKADSGIFSCTENRKIVEYEFLLKGIDIAHRASANKGLYPLGYNLWPSFGFGSFCASDLNISNTCPLVLWWGNTEVRGNVLDSWYPLLPRRVNADGDKIDFEEKIDILPILPSKDQYNMCPDCGKYFEIETDGGNGFCIDCSWNH